jgi:hypothetical protein
MPASSSIYAKAAGYLRFANQDKGEPADFAVQLPSLQVARQILNDSSFRL